MKRLFDFLVSLVGLFFMLILFFWVPILVKLDSKGSVFFRQTRVGKGMKPFTILKFRTMKVETEHQGWLTVGAKDSRVTKMGYWLRKFKLDELPQLWNVLVGEMSLVGPRPEVPKYVAYYTKQQKTVFDVRPGITDEASIIFRNESELLAQAENTEEFYIKEILPQKLNIGVNYVQRHTFVSDIKIMMRTINSIFH
jgi:lipopolysaccharide/colanic/teichoic acid biosynthesis glycosyltransferase